MGGVDRSRAWPVPHQCELNSRHWQHLTCACPSSAATSFTRCTTCVHRQTRQGLHLFTLPPPPFYHPSKWASAQGLGKQLNSQSPVTCITMHSNSSPPYLSIHCWYSGCSEPAGNKRVAARAVTQQQQAATSAVLPHVPPVWLPALPALL